MSKVDQIISELRKVYTKNANKEFAAGMTAYMKGHYEFYGIKMGLRRKIAKDQYKMAKALSKKDLINLVQRMYDEPMHEMHHTAVEFLEKNLRGDRLEKSDMKMLQKMVLQHSWWDTVDVIAPKIMSRYFEKFPEERNKKVDEWIASGNTWLMRCSILIHLKYREIDFPYLFETIERTCHTKEFFINKAIGWVLREHSKRHPEMIRDFIRDHEDQLSKLSIREGSKYI